MKTARAALTRKTVIITGYSCNNSCIFCNEAARRRSFQDKDTKTILAEIAQARERKSSYLELIGGEGTIRPDIFTLVKFARRQGFETVAMATNGRMMSYPEFAKKIIDAGITSVIFSVHGHSSKLHDFL
ncbi:MAG: radical SAM protein, partial [Elusimicrobia bacterium]|nr:radical SAM protein [Elusimicrobiota bacterium]